MPVTLEHCERTKSGKALRVKLSGSFYNAFLDSKLDQLPIGTLIEAEIQTSDKYGAGVKSWRPYTGPVVGQQSSPAYVPPPAPQQPVTREPVPEPQYAQPAAKNTVAPYWLPMASNIVAHAIQAGKIESPGQIKGWVDAVRVAVLTAVDDADIPY